MIREPFGKGALEVAKLFVRAYVDFPVVGYINGTDDFLRGEFVQCPGIPVIFQHTFTVADIHDAVRILCNRPILYPGMVIGDGKVAHDRGERNGSRL